jgi:type I site-specific restriction endonuclease
LSEADTCRIYVLPKLYAAGWTDEPIREQVTFTDGRIVPVARGHVRRPGKRADYVLRCRSHSIYSHFGSQLDIATRAREGQEVSHATP